MGLLDKVKATAQQAMEKAQEGVQTGQQKLADAQEKKRVDASLRDLGAALYLDRTGKGSPAITGDIERLMAELRDLEANGVVIEPPGQAAVAGGQPESPAAPGAGGSASPPTAPPAAEGGNFSLDDV